MKYKDIHTIYSAYRLHKKNNPIGLMILEDYKDQYESFIGFLLKEDGEGSSIGNVSANIGVDVDLEATTGVSSGYKQDNILKRNDS